MNRPPGRTVAPRWARSATMSPPATPKIAPDAPPPTTIGCTNTLARLPPRPLKTYTARNRRDPNRPSATSPRLSSAHILNARCRKPKCRNIDVPSRHHSPCSVSGPKSAPQRRICRASGSENETPATTIATKTSTLRPTRVSVVRGAGGRTGGAARAVIGSDAHDDRARSSARQVAPPHDAILQCAGGSTLHSPWRSSNVFYTHMPPHRLRAASDPRALILLALAAPGPLRAQQPAGVHVALATAPIPLNGRDSPVWASADSIVDFRQREPAAGAAASERTVVKVLRDDAALYVLVRAYDGDARHLRSTELRRDADLSSDDNVQLLIDSFHDRRGAFVFGTNPHGAMWDAQLVGVDDLNEDWK